MGDKGVEIAGGVSDSGELMVMLGRFPSMLRPVPPQFTPDVAAVIQVAIPAEDGEVAVKVNMRLFPLLIVTPPLLAVKFMVAVDKL